MIFFAVIGSNLYFTIPFNLLYFSVFGISSKILCIVSRKDTERGVTMGKNGYSCKNSQSENIVIPKMTSIRETSELTGIPEFTIRKLVKDEKIVFIKSGNRAIINVEKFVEFLNSGEGGGSNG